MHQTTRLMGKVMMAILRECFLSPWFAFGLCLRLSLVVACAQVAADIWYVPFFNATVGATFFDPWQIWAEIGGSPKAFPYGYAMWLIFLPFFGLQTLLGISGSWFYFATIFAVELLMMVILRLLAIDKSGNFVVLLFWLSPIALVPAYAYGFNDIIPAAFMVGSVYAVRQNWWALAGLLLAVAVSAKLSMIVAVPIFLLYFLNKASVREALPKICI